MNTYQAFYNGKQTEIKADSLYSAKQQAIREFSAPKSKQHMVSVRLAAIEDKQVTHTPDF